MTMRFQISEAESKKARIPHEIFLTNLIFNHILVFVAIISASSLAQYVVIVPIASMLVTTYLIFAAKRAQSRASWYVNGHWQVCAKRNRMFMIMIAIMGLVFLSVFLISGGNMRPQHWAVGGAAALPTMVTVLVLIIMESDALHQAKQGILPDWVKERYPEGALEPIEADGMAQEAAH
jgi:hypothetical protein